MVVVASSEEVVMRFDSFLPFSSEDLEDSELFSSTYWYGSNFLITFAMRLFERPTECTVDALFANHSDALFVSAHRHKSWSNPNPFLFVLSNRVCSFAYQKLIELFGKGAG